ncbi:MAG: hypothetical protein JOZ52_11985 [Acidobacteria bacterium]|nr:hypothetical protein [Acidobacteriota bacterium]
MRNYKLMVVLFLAVIVVTATATTTFTHKESKPSSVAQKGEEAERMPVASFNGVDKTTPEERAKRLEKGSRYDHLGLVSEQMAGLNVASRSGEWTREVPAIPVAQSDVIIVGEITGAEAYLSNDRQGVYSEFNIKVGEVLKNSVQNPVGGDSLVAERAGGAVSFPSGQIERVHPLYGQGFPQTGHRYLLFLKFIEGTRDLSLLTGYELKEARVSALDRIEPYLSNDNSDEASFLGRVRRLSSSPVNGKATEGGLER